METKNPILIDVPMPIRTDRLILRPLRVGDGEALFESKKESFEELKKWMPWAKELGTVEQSEITTRESVADFILRKDLRLVGEDATTGKIIVSTGLHRMNWDLRIFEIGYYVRTSETRKGYATEAANALIRYAFGALGASKVRIVHAGGNDASARVIEKLGFVKEGVLRRDTQLPDGTVTDDHWYARFDDKNLPPLKIEWGERT